MNSILGSCAIVTGGARGIGAAVAEQLVKAGVNVVIGDVLDEEGKSLAEALGAAARFHHLDVTLESDWTAVLDDAESHFGRVAVLVNNAGILQLGGIEECSPADMRRVLEVNLYGPWLGMHLAAPYLRASGGGVIVNVSSTAGLIGYSGLIGYTASKWGLRGMTKAAALDLAPDGIRVVSVHPGPIRTPMTAGFDESTVASQPIKRFGEPIEVAALIRFIVTEATFSTGSEFVVDGGATTGVLLPAHVD